MRLRFAVFCVLSLLVLSLATGCSKQEAPKQETPKQEAPKQEAPPAAPAAGGAAEGKDLFERKCSVCHPLDRATARKETKEKWASIVKDMQRKKADWISDSDAAKIVDFLAAEHGKK